MVAIIFKLIGGHRPNWGQPAAVPAEPVVLPGRDSQLAGALRRPEREVGDRCQSAIRQGERRLRAATKANPGIKVLAASSDAQEFYVATPGAYPDLSYYQSLGVQFVQSNNIVGGFFESLNWENADKYPAGLIDLDPRAAAMRPKDLTSKPSWLALPGVRAGQIEPWLSEPRFSYAGGAPVIEALASAIQRAKKVS